MKSDAIERAAAPPCPDDEAGAPFARSAGPLVPMIIGGTLFMQTFDSMAIANALPAMARTFRTDVVTMNLAITAYLFTTTIFLPVSAWVADRFGARRVFTSAIVGFAASSLLCGFAPNFPMLILGRMLQGLSGAMMLPVGRLVMLRSIARTDLVQAMSWLTMPALLGPILGPPIGGLLVTYLSWQWIFFINGPIGLLGFVLTRIYISRQAPDPDAKLDFRGFVLSACGLGGLVYGFDNLGRGVLSSITVAALLVIGLVCSLLYVAHARRAAQPIIDLSLLQIRTFTASTVGGLFSRFVTGATPFLLALLFQLGFGLSAFESGLLVFPTAVGSLVMKTTARPIIQRFGFRPVLISTAVVVAAITACSALFRADTPWWVLVPFLLAGGFVRSLLFTGLNSMAYADVPEPLMSRASSLSIMFQQLAQSLGVGLAALFIAQTVAWRGSATIGADDITPAFLFIAVLSLIAVVFYASLHVDAGAGVSGRRYTQGTALAGDET